MTSKQQFTTLIQGNATSGMQRINRRIEQLESLEVALNNYGGTTAPTVNDDISDGYSVGSFWYDLTSDTAYTCVDATSGAAVWLKIGDSLAGIRARVTNSSNISIPDNTNTTLTFNTETFDNGGFHSTSVNTERLTIPVDGVYLIGCNVSFVINLIDVIVISPTIQGILYGEI